MTDALTVEYSTPGGTRRRIRFEPRTDGPGYWRREAEFTGCRWRTVGAEPVRDLGVERAPDCTV